MPLTALSGKLSPPSNIFWSIWSIKKSSIKTIQSQLCHQLINHQLIKLINRKQINRQHIQHTEDVKTLLLRLLLRHHLNLNINLSLELLLRLLLRLPTTSSTTPADDISVQPSITPGRSLIHTML
jgi:hypothetical protein